jgi:hypothetical protein
MREDKMGGARNMYGRNESKFWWENLKEKNNYTTWA